MKSLADLTPIQPLAARLRTALAKGQLAHAYLVSGVTADERLNFARSLAQAIICATSVDDACGTCGHCQKAQSGNHPDISYWQADGSSFKVTQAHSLQVQAWTKPTECDRKVFVIDDADAFTAEAANSLLKLLEEPPGDAVFILLAASAQAVLPTIVSRTQPLALHGGTAAALPEAEATAWELLRRLGDIDEAAVLQVAATWDRDKAAAREQVQVLCELWRDLLALGHEAPREVMYRPDWAPRLQSLLKHWPLCELVKGLVSLVTAQRRLERNANVRLTLDVLFLELLPSM